MLIYDGTFIAAKTIEPSGNFTRPTHLLTVLSEDGEPLRLAADAEAFDAIRELEQLTPVRLRLRLRTVQTDKGRAFKMTVAALEGHGG